MMGKVAVAEDTYLKVHRAGDGSVWFIDGANNPVRSSLNIHTFAESEIVRRSPRIRMLGTWANAPLIARFYAFKTEKLITSIQAASPMVGQTRCEREDAQKMLLRMRDHPWPPSVGGWHEVTAVHYLPYLLATYFQYGEAMPGRVAEAMRDHPLVRYVNFIPHLNEYKLAELVATIGDPRWYCRWNNRDEFDPHSYINSTQRDAARLNTFLGLEPRILAGVNAGAVTPHHRRCRLVLETWKTSPPPHGSLHEVDHGSFLWQRWSSGKYPTTEKADLAVSKLFVDFLRQCWLDVLYRTTRSGVIETADGAIHHARPEGMFAPDHFFRPEEAKAFLAHLRR
jgi:hypothetical protein